MERTLVINLVLLGFSSVAQAGGHDSPMSFATAPVLGGAGLVALALGMGLGGAWAIRKYRDK